MNFIRACIPRSDVTTGSAIDRIVIGPAVQPIVVIISAVKRIVARAAV